VEDFNGDGTLDLAVANYVSSGTVSVLLGNGDGSFQAPHSFAAGSSSRALVVGDFNGDGIPDLAVTNDLNPDGRVSVLLGNGDGSFQDARSFAAGIWPRSVAVGDFNGDGRLDLVVANFTTANVSVLLGNGDGTFQDAVNFAAGSSPLSVAVGDFNGDGTPDLAVANNGSNDVSVLLGNGDGTFQAAHNFAAETNPFSVAVGDFNGDGLPDLAVAGYGGVRVLQGNGDGTFRTSPVSYIAGDSPHSVAVGDLNGDGSADLAVANEGSNDVSILLNDNAWPGASRRPGGPPPGDARAAATSAPALLPAPGVLPSDAGMTVLGTPWAVTMPVPGPSRLPFGVDADQGSAAAALALSVAASPEASVGGALNGGPPPLALLDRLFAGPTSGGSGDLLGEEPWSSTL
jgi:hypothetical protein